MNSQPDNRLFRVVIHPTLSEFFLISSDILPDDEIVVEYKRHIFATKSYTVRSARTTLDGQNSLNDICEMAAKLINTTDEMLFCIYINTDIFNKLNLRDYANKTV